MIGVIFKTRKSRSILVGLLMYIALVSGLSAKISCTDNIPFVFPFISFLVFTIIATLVFLALASAVDWVMRGQS